jgi:hypothetical protein
MALPSSTSHEDGQEQEQSLLIQYIETIHNGSSLEVAPGIAWTVWQTLGAES